MKKVLIVLAMLLSMLFVGCSSQSGSASNTTDNTQVEDTTQDVSTDDAKVPSGLPPIPTLPEE